MDNKSVVLLLLSPFVYSLGMLLEQKLFVLSFLSSIVFIYLVFKCDKSKESPIYGLTCTFIAFVLISGFLTFDYNYNAVRAIFLDRYYVLPYLCVLLAVVSYEWILLKVLNKIIILSTIFYIIFFFLNYSKLMTIAGGDALRQVIDNAFSLDSITKAFGMCSCFLMLLLPVLKNKYKLIVLVAFFMILSSSVFFGRRNMIFTNSLFFIGAGYTYLKYCHLNTFFRVTLYILFVFVGIYSVLNLTSFLENTQIGLFANLSTRIEVDSRSMVTDSFYNHMNDNFLKWILGSGLNSKYYCTGFVGGSSYRSIIETGYQHIIFKIGLIGLFLMIFIMFYALRVYKSNILITACYIYLIIYIVELYPAGVPTFELRHLLAWICVSICLDEKFHALTNDEVSYLLN